MSGFAKYYACNPEHGVVSRFGTSTFIGAERDPANPRAVKFDPSAVVGITVLEYARYRKEYDKAVANKSLVEKSAADLAAYLGKLSAPAKAEESAEDKPADAKKKSRNSAE